MPWIKANFKGKQVWALVDSRGLMENRSGRTPVRYSDKEGARIYLAGASRVEPLAGALPQDLPEAGEPVTSAGGSKSGGGLGSAGRRSAHQARQARQQASRLLARLPTGTHVVYTDGACLGNPGPSAAGAVVALADGRSAERARFLGQGTNQRAELSALLLALEVLDELDVPAAEPVLLLTDSRYAEGLLVKGWKARANKELVARLRSAMAARPGASVRWVAGHAGVEGNERVDRLATTAAREARDLYS